MPISDALYMTAVQLKELKEMSLKTRCALENMKSSYMCLPSLHDILRFSILSKS